MTNKKIVYCYLLYQRTWLQCFFYAKMAAWEPRRILTLPPSYHICYLQGFFIGHWQIFTLFKAALVSSGNQVPCQYSNWMSRRISGAGEESSSQTLCAATSTSTLATQTKFTVACIMCLCVCVRAVNMGSRTWKGSYIIFYCLLLFSLAWENSCKDNNAWNSIIFPANIWIHVTFDVFSNVSLFILFYNYPFARMQIMIVN